jgi:hypothetical protein
VRLFEQRFRLVLDSPGKPDYRTYAVTGLHISGMRVYQDLSVIPGKPSSRKSSVNTTRLTGTNPANFLKHVSGKFRVADDSFTMQNWMLMPCLNAP